MISLSPNAERHRDRKREEGCSKGGNKKSKLSQMEEKQENCTGWLRQRGNNERSETELKREREQSCGEMKFLEKWTFVTEPA